MDEIPSPIPTFVAPQTETPKEPKRFFFNIPGKKKLIVLILLIGIILGTIGVIFYKHAASPQISSEKTQFKLAEASPSDSQNYVPLEYEPTLVFSKKLSIPETDLNKYFTISPKIPGSWHLEKNGQVVYFSSDKKQSDSFPSTFEYDTVYTITISKDLPASSGEILKKENKLAFKTITNPNFTISSYTKLAISAPNKPLEVTFSDNSRTGTVNPTDTEYNVVGILASENQLLSYLSYGQLFYEFRPTSSNKEIFHYSLRLTKNKDQQLATTLPAFKNIGIYHITISNVYGKDGFFVVVSNHVNQVFYDASKLFVWTTDENGHTLKNVSVQTYSLTKQASQVQQGQTDASGLFKATQKVQDIGLVITKVDNDLAVTKLGNTSGNSNDYQIFSYTDRPVYRPGDKVHYKAVIRKRDKGSYVTTSEPLILRDLFINRFFI